MTKELPPEIDEAVAKDVTEIMVEYRRGIQNLAGAMRRMAKVTGLPPEICKVMLSGLSRNNIIDIRGSRTPQSCRGKSELSAELHLSTVQRPTIITDN
jgi:hypothetical protein